MYPPTDWDAVRRAADEHPTRDERRTVLGGVRNDLVTIANAIDGLIDRLEHE